MPFLRHSSNETTGCIVLHTVQPVTRDGAMSATTDDEWETLPPCDPFWARIYRATAYRKRLLAAGYLPIPVNGKAPPIEGWPDIEATNVLIDRWATKYADATNTGIITAATPAIDIDVLDPAVADELQDLAERMIGTSAVRTGRAPKRAMLFRTDEPFKKIRTPIFISPDGRTHKVEILGWGQQIVVHGIHPDTQHPTHGRRRTGPGSKARRTAATDRREGERIHRRRRAVHERARLDAQEENRTVRQRPCRLVPGSPKSPSPSANGFMRMPRWTAVRTNSRRRRTVTRNDTLYKKAFRLGTMAARGWISTAPK